MTSTPAPTRLTPALALGLALLAGAGGAALHARGQETPPSERDWLRQVQLQVDGEGERVRAVVEIPAFTREKFEVHRDTGHMAQDVEDGRPRVISFALPYPVNYGMLPQTLEAPEEGGDGDPLDVLILGAPLERGATPEVRLLGVMRMRDKGEVDDKILAVRTDDPLLGALADLEAVRREHPGLLELLALWFESYKRKPGRVQVLGWDDAAAARATVARCHQAFLRREAGR